jgi:serine/threonine-protein kinase PpkA
VQTVLIGDRYQICRRIGDGGMARVYLAWDTRLRLWCALKVMTTKAVEDEVLRSRFVHEGRALARLSHRNLVRFFDLVDEVETPFMAMEYLEGGTVAQRLAVGAIPERQAVLVAADVASALQVAHDAGIVHRDIKPHNLLLDRNGMVKVSDFGVARVDRERRLTMTNMSLGTLAYMPPEQQRDAAHVDHRVDVYALGATLWAMITGRRPTTLISGDRERSLQLLSPALEPIVRTATEASPDRRYPTAAAMELALRDALARLPPDDGSPLVADPTLVPSTPPVVAELELAPDEFTGTLRPWSGRTATPAPAPGGAAPSTVRTVGLDEVPTAKKPGVPPPPPPDLPELPPLGEAPRRSPLWFAAVGLCLALGVFCAGSCASLSCAGLFPFL